MARERMTKAERQMQLRRDNEYVDADAVCKALSMGVKSLMRMIDAGEFPRPFSFSRNIKRWHVDDIRCFIWLHFQMKPRMGRPDHEAMNRAVQVAKDRRDEGDGFVYFIRGGEFIKIGYAKNVQNRIAGLQTNCPYELKLVYSMPGTFQTEVGLHRRFKAHATSGEWFRWCDEIAEFIESMRSAGEQ